MLNQLPSHTSRRLLLSVFVKSGVFGPVRGCKHSVASSAGSQGSDQHSGQEEGSGEEAGQENQRRLGADQEPGQPEEVRPVVVLQLLSGFCCC